MGDREEEASDRQIPGRTMRFVEPLMNGSRFARIDGLKACCLQGRIGVSVTFPTPPEQGCRDVHVLDYVTRIAGRGPFRYHPWKKSRNLLRISIEEERETWWMSPEPVTNFNEIYCRMMSEGKIEEEEEEV
ncbi:uncharacterized protein LOC114935908 [Nylanderia fulva]|uniref:uncharacterized protein LOC114935908 n=1 Tax=Nylanderia fulva TaxID=613905 RepID=UPI0010FB1537|nr:uncharacterized protein LOC114935908 [Nylanderia fulva]